MAFSLKCFAFTITVLFLVLSVMKQNEMKNSKQTKQKKKQHINYLLITWTFVSVFSGLLLTVIVLLDRLGLTFCVEFI